MTIKSYQVLAEYDPKIHTAKLTKTESKCIKLLKKGTIFQPKTMIDDNIENLTNELTRNKRHATSCMVFKTLKIAKGLGIITEFDDKPISFNNFCNLETVSYFADQLRGSKNQNIKEPRKIVSTKKDYLYRVWEFNNWLHGKSFNFKTVKHLTENTFEQNTESIELDGVEHLLNLYTQSYNTDSDFIKIIKRFLNDDVHQKCSVGYMKLKHVAVLAYFEKNECELKFKYDPSVKHHDYSSASDNATLSLDDLGDMLRSGKASPLDVAVVLSKFQRGIDNQTFIDRFNYTVFDQLANYFGSEIFESWELTKCPVPIRLTRVKTDYTHTGFLDYDAINAIQKYLKIRYEKTGAVIKRGEPLFLNSRKQPISYYWISSVIPRLATNAGIQKRFKSGELRLRNEKTSHELRDLLKSTLIVEGVADYVCQLAIGHKVRDSYEKMDKLYPQKTRSEYAKASAKLNIVSKMRNSIKDDYDSIDEIKSLKEDNAEIKEKFKELKEASNTVLTWIARQENKKK